MNFAQLLPPMVRDLLKHVPTLVWDVMDWESVRRDAPLMAARLLSQSGVEALKVGMGTDFGDFLSFQPSPPGRALSPAERGDLVLRLYFSQLEREQGVFLDLRPEHFTGTDGKLFFKPNGFWYRFSPAFRSGILDLYDGFYFDDDARFEKGLFATGLLSEKWPVEDRERIKTLFRSHFGEARDRPMRFSLGQFQKTFVSVFEFLIEKKVRLSSEFMLFGIYLVTLYLSLEASGASHDVGRIYREVRTRSIGGIGSKNIKHPDPA
jgi:hypothetical protein